MRVRLQVFRHWFRDFRPLAVRRLDDGVIERQWRRNVARNPKEIARVRNAPAAVPPKHRCGDIDCMQCWDAGVRYGDYQKAQVLEDWLYG